ncbi:inosine/xanthosine triphosphatase [Halobellus rarus]|uniref:inosine/xanthosine triphosphatase n=1 Tax=Halobellus rarus TaxID=1126237 RepID=A0ABD6CJG9_9EURY|nr:inosine/xanthosine triphosphatase [Halobellus rarus]
MRIAVGSGNPVKREATVRVFPDDEVVAEPVSSGVSEQPMGHEETRQGARNRAAAALGAGAYDLGVGIEGGVASVGGPATGSGGVEARAADAELYLVMWSAVTDGDRWGVGAGPSLPLPTAIAARVRDGEELGPVMDDVLGESNVAENQGAAGAFTDGRLTRTDALDAAVAAAASPFLSDLY